MSTQKYSVIPMPPSLIQLWSNVDPALREQWLWEFISNLTWSIRDTTFVPVQESNYFQILINPNTSHVIDDTVYAIGEPLLCSKTLVEFNASNLTFQITKGGL